MKPINLRSKENEVCQTISNQEKQEIREPPKQSVPNQWVIWIILHCKMNQTTTEFVSFYSIKNHSINYSPTYLISWRPNKTAKGQ